MSQPYDVTGNIIAFETGELDEAQTIELFQHLIDNGMAWSLQGSYGRMAKRLIDAGYCTDPRNPVKVDTISLTKSRSTWHWFHTNVQGGGFGSNLCGPKRAALAAAIRFLKAGTPYRLIVNGEDKGMHTV